jgi:phosphoribosylanthranilate isomerase
MSRTRIKICGITRPADALAAEAAGCDAIGFVFWEDSPRFVTAEQAADIARCLSPTTATVGVFVSPTVEHVAKMVGRARLRAAQLYGALPEGHWNWLTEGFHLIRAISAGNLPPALGGPTENVFDYLFDTIYDDRPGGTGRTFDWSLLRESASFPRVWLAGGLNASNVGDAIRAIHPFAVDVSTGVEDRPGIKSAEKIEAFVRAVRAADESMGD